MTDRPRQRRSWHSMIYPISGTSSRSCWISLLALGRHQERIQEDPDQFQRDPRHLKSDLSACETDFLAHCQSKDELFLLQRDIRIPVPSHQAPHWNQEDRPAHFGEEDRRSLGSCCSQPASRPTSTASRRHTPHPQRSMCSQRILELQVKMMTAHILCANEADAHSSSLISGRPRKKAKDLLRTFIHAGYKGIVLTPRPGAQGPSHPWKPSIRGVGLLARHTSERSKHCGKIQYPENCVLLHASHILNRQLHHLRP